MLLYERSPSLEGTIACQLRQPGATPDATVTPGGGSDILLR